MQFSWHRVAGAVGFALAVTSLMSLLSLRPVSLETLRWPLVTGVVIGYIMYPCLAYAWRQRAPWQPTRRRVAMTVAIADSLTIALQSFNAWVSGNDIRPISVLASFLFMGSLIYMNLGHNESWLRGRAP